MKTPKQIDTEIARRNTAFTKATPAQRRVLVAKDVLKLVKDLRVIPHTGNWVCHIAPPDSTEGSLQRSVLGGQANCHACALGSILVSLVAFQNNVRTFEASELLDFASIHRSQVEDVTGIKKLFSATQLKAIEIAFEGGEGFFSPMNDFDIGRYKKACRFGEEFRSEKDRLVAIMENIVKNNGTFIP